jgi:sigma-B regulation protein RsbU (phosphoserine phosphatase)
MGMVKTVVHHGVLLGQPLTALLDGINKVLPEVKEPSMYATLSAIRFDGSSQLEYTSAGHLPLLHFRRSSHDVTHCSIEQFPLGLFPAATYSSDRVQCGPGDLLAIVTDGMSETCDASGEDFGLERLAQLLRENATRPLSEIFQIMLTAVTKYGKQDDDRTLLLVRILG